jgi:chromosome segregation protein
VRFKNIVLQGFKSFVDRTELSFEGGISCIVGPNGSGKSNIMDAFRWVFGEQNPKELRGSGMEDVIFAGSETRKPSGFAEVSLTISDVDENITAKWGTLSEITIGRKYYRTGEREYLINNRKCKLKDIKEIFYDTGIGARSISIIEQGKVEKIIQASPEDLRLFFEETAGVVKYREKKKEAERRLNQTKENLFRVNDILSEIKEKQESLIKQLEKLNKYKSLKAELDNLERKLIINEYKKYSDEIKNIQNKIGNSKISLTEKIALFDEERRREFNLQKKSDEIQNEIKKLSEIILTNIKKSHQVESEIKILENNILNAEKSKISLKSEIEQIQIKLKNLTTSREDIYNQKSSIQMQLQDVNEKIEEQNSILEEVILQKDDVDDELSHIESKFLHNTQKITNLHNEIYRFETNIQRLEKEKERFLKEKENIKKEIILLETQQNKINESFIKNQELYEKLNVYLSKLNIEEDNLISEKDKMESNLSQLRIDYSVCEENLKLNSKQLDTLSFGDEESIEILKNLNAKLLIDYIPVEKNLLNEIGDILVFDDENKERVIQSVENLKGSFRFIFKSDMEVFEKELLSLNIKHLSDSIYIVNSLHKKIGSENKNLRISKLKKEIAELSAKKIKLKIEIDNVEEKIKTINNKLVSFKNKSNDLKKQINDAEIILKTTEKELKNVDENINSLKRRQKVIDSELNVNKKENENSKNKLEKICNELEIVKNSHSSIDEEKEELEEKRNFLILKIEDIKDTISEYKINQRGLTEKLHSIQKEIHYAEQEITNNTNKISQLKSRLEKILNVDLTKWKNGLDEKKEQFKILKKEEINFSDKKKYLENKLYEELENLKLCGEMADKIQSEIRKIENKINDFLLKRTQFQSEIEHLSNSYYEKFKEIIDENISEYVSEKYELKKTKSEINRIKQLIEGLGALNMAAETEYNEINERFEFLKKQKDDLEESIAKINELIFEINDNTATQFKQTFNAVNDNFTDVFKILFGNNGKAELRLTNSNDLLTTGVDIFVQPPGKKLQNMNLLSGGEKAMTACSLLFAMFLYKPTPFCFLDEVDAPLDDANISRFVNIVRKLSKKSQFVIITHNQKTMEEADSIYGVTMQEPGVSSILSVRLN